MKATSIWSRANTSLLMIGMAMVVSACGDSSGSSSGTINGDPVTVATVPAAAITSGATASGLIGLSGNAKCDVKVSTIDYDTVGGKGENTNGTAAVMVPGGTDAACTGARPIVLLAHGTDANKNKNMANVAGSPADGEALLAMTIFAAQGYIVIAPNYAGYNASKLTYHPYLNADQQSQDMIDALRATKSSLTKLGATASAKLFVTGYSQGGFVAMATVKAIQTKYSSEFTVTGSAPLAGPYALSKIATLPLANPALQGIGAAFFTPLVVDSYQNSYGNIYTTAAEIYAPAYAPNMVGLFPTVNVAAAAAKLPAGDGTYRTLYDLGNGQPFLINKTYQTAALDPASNYQKAFARNDLTTGWKPSSPMVLCHGGADLTVNKFNSVDAAAAFASPASVFRWDLEDAATLPAGTASLKAAFDSTKAASIVQAGGGAAGEAIVIASSYHGGLVPPFCYKLAAVFFSGL